MPRGFCDKDGNSSAGVDAFCVVVVVVGDEYRGAEELGAAAAVAADSAVPSTAACDPDPAPARPTVTTPVVPAALDAGAPPVAALGGAAAAAAALLALSLALISSRASSSTSSKTSCLTEEIDHAQTPTANPARSSPVRALRMR